MGNQTLRIAFTPGEPAGVGPDLAVRLMQRPLDEAEIVTIADSGLLHERARLLGLPFDIEPANFDTPPRRGGLRLDAIELAAPCRPGRPDPANARYVLAALDRAVSLCQEGRCDALVTGPVHKAAIREAGIDFDGHTGYLAERLGANHPVMMLATEGLRVALATVHIPLRSVPGALSRENLTQTLRVLHDDLQARFGIDRPRILVAGLNPHAGESGHLGREEIDVIEPVLRQARAQGMDLAGPLPADTLFTPNRLREADAVLAMYHDQGLPVIKHHGFGRTVNITLGLPIVRTSVDHGTALDIVGTDRVDTGSLAAAFEAAIMLARPNGT